MTKIIPDSIFPAPLTLWSWEPRQIEDKQEIPLNKDSYIMRLRYAAMELLSSEFLVWEDTKLCRDEIEAHASVCDDSLYLNDFMGYRLSDTLILKYLYMNADERMCAAVYDEVTDDFTYWLIY